jgi:hypothetical protein
MKWLPDPTFTTDKMHYKTFQDLYGTDTNDTDCPSVALRQEREKEASSFFTAAKVRGVDHVWLVINLGVCILISRPPTRRIKILSLWLLKAISTCAVLPFSQRVTLSLN